MLHKVIPLGEIHAIHNWEVDNAAALAALVPIESDKGKLAWQLDTNEFHFLVNHVGPVWQAAVGVIGPAGADGSTILNGIVAPTTEGVDGDFYIDTLTLTIYGPKAAGVWPAGVSLIGATGAAGADGSDGTNAPKVLPVACSDESTALTAGTSKVTFRMPYAMTVSAVRASLTIAQTSGTVVTVDINETGTSILSTKLTIDNTEKTSTTAAIAAVISDTALADDAEITIDIDALGDGTAKGLKVYLIGT